MNNGNGIRILLYDLETSPNLSWTWGVWEQDVIEKEQEWQILSFAAKWYGEKKITVVGQCDTKGYKKGKLDDEQLLKILHKMISEADVVVGHNSDSFDNKKMNARFLIHGMWPPRPYKTMDTLKMARRHFKFDSNKLDALGASLGVGRKLPHTGKHLWLGCMRGEEKDWKMMKRYNKQDVVLLERVYERLRPWDRSHINLDFMARQGGCPRCHSKRLHRSGYRRTLTREYTRYRCNDCGGWCFDGGERLYTKPLRIG